MSPNVDVKRMRFKVPKHPNERFLLNTQVVHQNMASKEYCVIFILYFNISRVPPHILTAPINM